MGPRYSLTAASKLPNIEAAVNEYRGNIVDHVDTSAKGRRPVAKSAASRSNAPQESRECVPPEALLEESNVLAVNSIERFLDKGPRRGATWTGGRDAVRLPD